MTPKFTFTEENVSWNANDYTVEATLARPIGAGPFPAVIFVAGSGPTDRNWNSPMLPGTNGSGGLLARALTEQGFITLRYDKGAAGPHAQENVMRMVGKVSMASHTAELAGGVNLLMQDAAVDPAKVFALTNSEGCVHALNLQTQSATPPFAGMVLTSAFARPTGVLARSQIAAQFTALPDGAALMAAYDAAMTDFMAERPVQVDENLLTPLRQMILGITHPFNLPFARQLWMFNPLTVLGEVQAPVLILIGKKDIQVDWLTDGPLFESVAAAHPNIAVVYAENASHVLKFEPKARAELTAAEVMMSYGSDQVQLDPEPVQDIIAWLQARL